MDRACVATADKISAARCLASGLSLTRASGLGGQLLVALLLVANQLLTVFCATPSSTATFACELFGGGNYYRTRY